MVGSNGLVWVFRSLFYVVNLYAGRFASSSFSTVQLADHESDIAGIQWIYVKKTRTFLFVLRPSRELLAFTNTLKDLCIEQCTTITSSVCHSVLYRTLCIMYGIVVHTECCTLYLHAAILCYFVCSFVRKMAFPLPLLPVPSILMPTPPFSRTHISTNPLSRFLSPALRTSDPRSCIPRASSTTATVASLWCVGTESTLSTPPRLSGTNRSDLRWTLSGRPRERGTMPSGRPSPASRPLRTLRSRWVMYTEVYVKNSVRCVSTQVNLSGHQSVC